MIFEESHLFTRRPRAQAGSPDQAEVDKRADALQALIPGLFPSRGPAKGWGPEVIERVEHELCRYRGEASHILAAASASDAQLPSYAARLVPLAKFISESHEPGDKYLEALVAAFDTEEKVQAAETFMNQWKARNFSSLAGYGEEKRNQEQDLRNALDALAANEAQREPSKRMTAEQLADYFSACLEMHASLYIRLHETRRCKYGGVDYWNHNIQRSVSAGAQEMALAHRDPDDIRWMTQLFEAVVDYRAPRDEQDRMWTFFLTVLDFGKKYGLRKEAVQAFAGELWPRMKRVSSGQGLRRQGGEFGELLRAQTDEMVGPKVPAPRPIPEKEPVVPVVLSPEEAERVLQGLDARLAEFAAKNRGRNISPTVELSEQEVEALNVKLAAVKIAAPKRAPAAAPFSGAPVPVRPAPRPVPPKGNPPTARQPLAAPPAPVPPAPSWRDRLKGLLGLGEKKK